MGLMRTADPALVLVDKPAGWTSRKAGAVVSQQLGVRKVGHLGTLDPFATGLLPLCVGRGTRLSYFLEQDSKAYEAEVQLGAATDSLDCDGEVIAEADVPHVPLERVQALAQSFVGMIDQTPPAHSAIRVGGQRAYVRARRGEAVEMPVRQVRIDALDLELKAPDRLWLRVACGSGTYIRTLGADLAQALGTVGYLRSLRRLSVGVLQVDDAAAPEALQDSAVWSTARLLSSVGAPLELEPVDCRWVRDGKPLVDLPSLKGLEDGRYGVFDAGEPVALIARQNEVWSILRGLPLRS